MNNINPRNITNFFQDVRLVSLTSLPFANEITPRDHGGPYMVVQEGYDPEDAKSVADEFVLGRSGEWLSLSYYFRIEVAERRTEYVFGTAAEIMELMESLPSTVAIIRLSGSASSGPITSDRDEMKAIRGGR